MGFGDEIPKQVLGRQPYRNLPVTPIAKRFKKQESGSEAFLIPPTPHPAARLKRGGMGNVGASPQTPQGNIVPLTLTTLSLRDS